MALSHRPVTESDFETICRFPGDETELLFFHPRAAFPRTPSALAETIAGRAAPTVVLCDGEVAGFADIYDIHPGTFCRIGNVIVSPDHRGRGVASYLIRQMIRIARETYQAQRIELACFNVNTAGLLLYAKLGFEPYAVEMRDDRRGNPLALIQLRHIPDS